MNLNMVYEKLDGLFERQKYKEAEHFLLSQIAEAEQENDKAAVLSLCNELGGYYRVSANYTAGIASFEKALRIAYEMEIQGTEYEATIRLNLATLYVALHETRKAFPEYERAAAIYESRGIRDYRLAALHNNISSLYLEEGRYEKASENANAALELLGGETGNEDELGVTNTILAQIHLKRGEYPAAREAAERAEAAFSKLNTPNPVHLAALYSTMGAVCIAIQETAQAMGYYERSLSMLEKSFGRNLTYAAELRNLAACCNKAGDLEREKECLRMADEIDAAVQTEKARIQANSFV